MKKTNAFRWTMAFPASLLVALFACAFVTDLFPEPRLVLWSTEFAVSGLFAFPIVALVTGVMVAPLHGKRFFTIVAFLFIITCLFPPWQYTAVHSPAGYALLFTPPNHYAAIQIDFGRLFLEWVVLAAVTGMAWMLVLKPARAHDDKAKQSPPPI